MVLAREVHMRFTRGTQRETCGQRCKEHAHSMQPSVKHSTDDTENSPVRRQRGWVARDVQDASGVEKGAGGVERGVGGVEKGGSGVEGGGAIQQCRSPNCPSRRASPVLVPAEGGYPIERAPKVMAASITASTLDTSGSA